MAERERWQLEGSAPELYQRYIVPVVTALWAADLVAWAAPLASIVGPMEETKREALVEALADELTAALQPEAGEAGLTFPQEAHVLLARK
jgi:hypothetical protein